LLFVLLATTPLLPEDEDGGRSLTPNRYDCNGSRAQQWLVSRADGTVRVAADPSFCLDAGSSEYAYEYAYRSVQCAVCSVQCAVCSVPQTEHINRLDENEKRDPFPVA
jgi:hypothetical protein